MLDKAKKQIAAYFRAFHGNPVKLVSVFFEILVVFLLILESGFLFFKFGASSRLRMIALIALALSTAILYLTSLDFASLKHAIKTKRLPRPSFAFCFLVLYSLVIAISFLVNGNRNKNLYSYLDLLALGWIAVLFIKSVGFKRFCHVYSKVIAVVCVIALVLYLINLFVDVPFASSVYFHDGYIIENYGGFYFDYSTNLEIFAPISSTRVMGIFWEPGVFASHILIALLIDFVILKKPKLTTAVLEIACLVLTFSTAGWLLLPIITIAFLSERFKGTNKSKGINVISVSVAVLFAVFVVVAFRDKLLSSNSSLLTRVLSPYYSLLVFIKKPFFGFGPVSANEYYYSIAPSTVTAMTSTPGYLMMSIGFFGLFFLVLPVIGILKEKRLALFTRVVLCAFFLLATSKENQSSIFAIFIFYFYFVFKNIRFKWEKRSTPALQESVLGALVFRNNTSVSSNVFWAFLVKLGAMAIGLIIIPVFNSYFGNDTSYGVWLTMISILSWILMFDFGFSNGLRSKLAASLQSDDRESSKKLVSSTYKVSVVLGSFICVAGLILAFVLDWNTIYNIDATSIASEQLRTCMAIILCSVGLQFALRPILSVLEAMKKSAIANSLALLSNIMLVIYALVSTSFNVSGSYIALAVVYLLCINGPLVAATIIVFKKNSFMSPSFAKSGDQNLIRGLVKLNAIFFLIQISQLLLYGINDILIANMFDPSCVSDYTKYYKLFATIISTFTGVFQAPLWVAVARAKERCDISKIKKLSKLTLLCGLGFLFLNALVFVSLPVLFEIWLGDKAPVFSWTIAAVFFVDAAIRIACCTITIVGNGLEAVKSQAIVFFIAALLKIPLSLLFQRFLPSEMSFSVAVLSGDAVIWIALITLPIEVKRKLKIIRQEGALAHEENDC